MSNTSAKKPVSTTGAPGAIGPYSQAIVAGGFVHCSGQIGVDPASGEVVGGVVQQAERALTSLGAVLEEAGSSFAQVVKCNVYLTSMGDFAAVNEVYARFFPDPPPARACVEVSGLPKGVEFEVDCVALTEG